MALAALFFLLPVVNRVLQISHIFYILLSIYFFLVILFFTIFSPASVPCLTEAEMGDLICVSVIVAN